MFSANCFDIALHPYITDMVICCLANPIKLGECVRQMAEAAVPKDLTQGDVNAGLFGEGILPLVRMICKYIIWSGGEPPALGKQYNTFLSIAGNDPNNHYIKTYKSEYDKGGNQKSTNVQVAREILKIDGTERLPKSGLKSIRSMVVALGRIREGGPLRQNGGAGDEPLWFDTAI